MKTTITTTIAAVGLVLAGLALGGCSAGSTEQADPTKSAGTQKQQGEKYDADMNTCMKEAGYDMDDPEVTSPDRPQAVTDAYSACEKKFGERPSAVDPNDPVFKASSKAYAEAYTKCFNDLGFEVPTVEGEPSATMPEGATEDQDATCSAAATKASEKVEKEMSK